MWKMTAESLLKDESWLMVLYVALMTIFNAKELTIPSIIVIVSKRAFTQVLDLLCLIV
jgi:hypothetical protein